MPSIRAITLLLCGAAIAGCGGGGGGSGPPAPPPVQTEICTDRGALCADELTGGSAARLVDNRYYLPDAGAGPALHSLSGTIDISPTTMTTTGVEPSGRVSLPGLTVQFLTIDDTLLPLERDIISGGQNRWSVILSPGKVWSETNDQGRSRASFPFTLVTEKWNEAHNGVATFLYDDTSVTNLRLQVMQETATWNKIDFWAVALMSYTPEAIADAAAIEADFRDELAARVETLPWSDLLGQFGGGALAPFGRGISSAEISGAGVLIDNTLYYQAGATRRGAFPYPLEMRHGVFSVTKSAAAAATLLRLAESYGPQVFDLFVTDYLDVTAPHSGWNGVTFGHLLSMVAGIGNASPDPAVGNTFADENDGSNPIWNAMWDAASRSQKLEHAFRYDNYPWEPGQIVRYNTVHTFVLGAAMDSFYKTMEGPDADVWQMMLDEVYRPIGIRALPTIKTRGAGPLPIYGFGLFLNAYDTARIIQLFHNDGAWDGQQLLHRALTRQSLYKDGEQGFPTASTTLIVSNNQAIRYLNSFWSIALDDGPGCTVRIPYMWGFGGNFVVVLPNGTAAYRYADAGVHDPAALGLTARAVRPLCP